MNSLLHDTALPKTSSMSKAFARSAFTKSSKMSCGGSPFCLRACLHYNDGFDARLRYLICFDRRAIWLNTDNVAHMWRKSDKSQVGGIGHSADQHVYMTLREAALETSRHTISHRPPASKTKTNTRAEIHTCWVCS